MEIKLVEKYNPKIRHCYSTWKINDGFVNLDYQMCKYESEELLRKLIHNIEYKLNNKLDLIKLTEEIGTTNILKLFFLFSSEIIVPYIDYFLIKCLEEQYFSCKKKYKGQWRYVLKMIIGKKSHRQNNIAIYSDAIKELIEKQFQCYSRKIILQYMEQTRALDQLTKTIPEYIVHDVVFSADKDLLKNYINYFGSKFTEQRETITLTKISKMIFGRSIVISRKNSRVLVEKYINVISKYVDEEYNKQCKIFTTTNYQQMKINNDIWKFYWMHGPSLHSATYDFTKIQGEHLRYEAKLFMKYRFEKNKSLNDTAFYELIVALNFFVRYDPKIDSLAKVKIEHIRALVAHLENDYKKHYEQKDSNNGVSVATMTKIIGICRQTTDFLINYAKKNKLITQIPKNNLFNTYAFYNTSNMHKGTEIIPDIVDEQIMKHLQELEPRYQLIYYIFSVTGLRLKEVIHLEEDCLESTEWESLMLLKYTPYKSLMHIRKQSRSEKNTIIIPKEIAKVIKEQCERTKELREEHLLTFIFIHKREYYKPALTEGKGFLNAIRRLIKKYDIRDYDGELWHLTTKQFRKTTITNMIENGATRAEISYQLGHLSSRTSRKYYDEVRRMTLKQLNTDFFKKKFEVAVGDEQLQLYTEEERKALYIDFRLNNRNVLLGYCTKHISEGECGKKVGKSNCTECNKLCTGKKYLSEWISLKDEQQKIVYQLEEIYRKEEINYDVYRDFREYEKEVHFLNLYKDIISKIESQDY
ncbi:MAG: site-specific integrase [Clostridiaceae bacterium]|nr:site-specific integrase [Clostridiaceae bacterium]